ncbi:MAG: YqiJ family protein [Ectothiorhodospiraceae bacterium]|nr:YqiJ family protein [Ectothiorhodospiraceae bacterium]
MIEFIVLDGNGPFFVALLVMLIITVLEIASMLLGTSLSGLVDSFLPDMDASVDADIQSPSGLGMVFGWLGLGRVPALILLIIFLSLFGVLGILAQLSVNSITGALLPAWMVSAGVLLLTMPVMGTFARIFGKWLPKDESSAVSESSFIGVKATITIGTSRRGMPAKARLKDDFGQDHYVMVEPLDDGVEFPAQSDIVLMKQVITKQKGSLFFAVPFDENFKI